MNTAEIAVQSECGEQLKVYSAELIFSTELLLRSVEHMRYT
jgi:hypothetical protein